MNPSQHPPAAALLRDQFYALDSVGVQLSLDQDRRRRILLIGRQDWLQWLRFLHDGPLPAQPAVPVMLRRLAAATFRLAALVERQAV